MAAKDTPYGCFYRLGMFFLLVSSENEPLYYLGSALGPLSFVKLPYTMYYIPHLHISCIQFISYTIQSIFHRPSTILGAPYVCKAPIFGNPRPLGPAGERPPGWPLPWLPAPPRGAGRGPGLWRSRTPIYLSIYLPIYQSTNLSISIYMYASLYIYIYIRMYIYVDR